MPPVMNINDRLISASSVAGASIVFTSDGTDNFLQHTNGRLIFNDREGNSRLRIYGPNDSALAPGVSIQGSLFVGRGTQVLGTNPHPATSTSLFGIAEKMSTFAFTNAAIWSPDIDTNVLGQTITLASFVARFTNPFESTDGGDSVFVHWDEDYDGAVSNASHNVTSTNYIFQTYTTTSVPSAGSQVWVKAYRTGNPGTVIAKIYSVDGAHKPVSLKSTSTALDVSAITTSSTGEWIIITIPQNLFYFDTLTASTEYGFRLQVTGAGTLTVLSEEPSAFGGGYGFTSIDSGASWSEIPPGAGAGTFLFDQFFRVGVGFTITGCNFQLSGSFAGNAVLGWATNARMIDCNVNISIPAGSPAWTNLIGIDVRTLSVSGGTAPTRSYGLKIGTAGNGTTSWGMNTGGRIQFNTATQLIFGGTATTVGVNYIARGGTNEIGMGLGALTNSHYLWTATAYHPTGTVGTQSLGIATTGGWSGTYFKDASASFTALLQFNSATTALTANRTLTVELNNGSRTFKMANSGITETITLADWFDQALKVATTTVKFAGLRVGAFGLDIGTGTLPTTTWCLIAAGAAGYSQIQLTASTAPSSPVAGDIWYDSGNDAFSVYMGLQIRDGKDFIIGGTTGSKVGQSGSKVGWWGATPVARNTGWSVTGGYTSDKAFDPETTTLLETARVLGTLVDALKTYGILGA